MDTNIEQRDERSGVVPVVRTWVGSGARIANQVVTSGFAAAGDLHSEWKQRIGEWMDFVDSTQRGTMSLVRKLFGHFDDVVDEVLRGSESATRSLVKTIEVTARDATELAGRTGDRLIGANERAA